LPTARPRFSRWTVERSAIAGSVLQLDFDYDFKTDIALAGAAACASIVGHSATFTDVTAETKLPQSVLNGRYRGAWAVDNRSGR
jgi:hypothetical protein